MSLAKFNEALPGFSSFFGRDMMETPNWFFQNSTTPAVNVKETNDQFLVEVAAPGLKKDDFRITLDNHLLTISSEVNTPQESQDENGKYTRREFSYHSFRRSFTVPNTVDTERIQARYENGVLHIHIPKKEEARRKPLRTIEIA